MATNSSVQTAGTARILGASLVGTAVEFYDFYIYATAASLIFGPLFFPSHSATAQLMLAYASFGVAFVARPVGAFVFGHFGDRLGRKSTLVVSLMLMGGSTFLIGLLPSYQMWGWVAPAILCLLRFGQGFGLGGEWGGAALLAVENAPEGWRGRYGMFPQLGAPVGFLASNGIFLLLGTCLTPAEFEAWGWRIPFLASAVLVAIGLWVRLKITETPEFLAKHQVQKHENIPMVELLRDHWKATLCGTMAVIACFAIFYISTAFALGYGTTTLGIGKSVLLSIQLLAILFMALGIILAGIFSDKFSPERVLGSGCLATVFLGVLIGPLLGSSNLYAIFAFLALSLMVMGFVYGPLGGWLPTLFPVHVRYTGVSMTFNMGGIFGGATAPFAAQFLADRWGLHMVGFYLGAAGLLSLVGVIVIHMTKVARTRAGHQPMR